LNRGTSRTALSILGVIELPEATIYYFSGTGNTWAIALLYKEALETAGWQVELAAIDGLAGTPEVRGDLLILGYPVHAWNMPFLVREFIESLPERKGLKAAAFMTMGAISRGAPAITWRLLAEKGYEVLGVEEYVMPTNWVLGERAGTEESFYALREEAAKKARQAVADLVAGKVREVAFVDSEIEFSETSYARFRRAFPKWAGEFTVGESCTLCSLCVDLCPMNNLRMEGRTVVYGKECVLCLRCINLCPERAIEWRDKTQTIGRYQAPGFAKAIRAAR